MDSNQDKVYAYDIYTVFNAVFIGSNKGIKQHARDVIKCALIFGSDASQQANAK